MNGPSKKGKGEWAKKKGHGNEDDSTKSQKGIIHHYFGKAGDMKGSAERGWVNKILTREGLNRRLMSQNI